MILEWWGRGVGRLVEGPIQPMTFTFLLKAITLCL